MKRDTFPIILTAFGFLLLNIASQNPQDKRDIQAYVLKVKNDVRKSVATSAWTAAITGDKLKSGYQVRTEDASLAIIKFSDDSKIIVRPKSIVTIKGEMQGKQILDRSVHTERGNLAFDVKKQEKEQFRFSSPVSVASIRGTEGAYIAGVDSVDLLIINRGSATLTNLISNRSTDVNTGQTGYADGRNGESSSHQSSNDEKDLGSSNPDNPNNKVGGGQGGGQQGGGTQKTKHSIRIPGVDKDGNPKTIILEWQD